jgi:hypothetical protein
VVTALPAATLHEAGPGVERVCDAESAAREAYRRLLALEPWTEGTVSRARRVLHSLATLVEERNGRIARAIRAQRRPWLLDDEPIRSTLARVILLIGQAAEIARVVVRVRPMQARLRALHAKVAADLPSAWDRLYARRGLDAESLEHIVSSEELAVVQAALRRSLRAIVAWRRDVRRWLATRTGEDVVDGESRAGLEARYELLLRLGRIDRAPLQRRSSEALRSAVHRHVSALAAGAGARIDDPLFRLVGDWAVSYPHDPWISREELETYRAAVSEYQGRTDE